MSMPSTPAVPTLSLANGIDADALFHALTETGFVIVTDHGIDLSELEATYASVERFFSRPVSEKETFITGDGGQRGYTRFGTENAKDNPVPDLKEFWHVGRDAISPNVWPDEPSDFRQRVTWLYEQIDALGLKLLSALTSPLNIPESTFDDMAAGGNSVLRLLHYPPIPDDADPNAVRAAAHEDINLITLLVAASCAGLELLDRTDTWRAIEAPENAIIVDAGDMLARITNGRIPATTHRVVNPDGPNKSRYSMPFFLHPKSEAVLSVFPQFKDGTEEPDITGGAFLDERLREIGLKA
ncbi:MAG: isopenicillin N synthase family oxygenase [Parvularculaceae bacterium]|nr:isopenicillin N synthase family oxygenase [Parvularculaceae bacterium]